MTSYFSPHLLGAEVHITSARCYGWVPIYKITGKLPSGWWYTYPSEKYEFVSWEGWRPNIWWKIKHVWNHQPAICLGMSGGINIIKHPYLNLYVVSILDPQGTGVVPNPSHFFVTVAEQAAPQLQRASQAGRPVWHQTNCEYFEHCANLRQFNFNRFIQGGAP